MILTCPSCTKRFMLDAGLLGQGRRVKCGQCGHIWFAEPPPGTRPAKPAPSRPDAREKAPPSPPPPFAMKGREEEPTGADSMAANEKPEDDVAPLMRSMRQRPLPKGSNLPALPGTRLNKDRLRSLLAWSGITAALVLVGGGAVLGRDKVMDVWPASFRLYEMVGLAELIGTGLTAPGDSKTTKVEVRDLEGINLLFVTGAITNQSDRQRDVPDIQAVAYGEDGKELFAWRIIPPVRRLFPNQTTKFESRVPEREGAQAKNIGFRYIEPEAVAP
ncbi:zinc-ribbon domain-containing protein [Niveispirillum irakense]|uniref:zinc-ribbon domain-containing protein n=1 Tax=Niveispirillum irakense TaxID=34011 RepID=UPI0004171D8B|nr:zinc-ribbon domain-containing protein [Niveispirillum irakense]